jgi:hypothetical protein
MIDAADLELLRESERTHTLLRVTVSGCAYACCGRGWQRRDGYEQEYVGYVNPLNDESSPVTFLLVAPGLGTISYTCAIRESEVLGVERRGAPVG